MPKLGATRGSTHPGTGCLIAVVLAAIAGQALWLGPKREARRCAIAMADVGERLLQQPAAIAEVARQRRMLSNALPDTTAAGPRCTREHRPLDVRIALESAQLYGFTVTCCSTLEGTGFVNRRLRAELDRYVWRADRGLLRDDEPIARPRVWAWWVWAIGAAVALALLVGLARVVDRRASWPKV